MYSSHLSHHRAICWCFMSCECICYTLYYVPFFSLSLSYWCQWRYGVQSWFHSFMPFSLHSNSVVVSRLVLNYRNVVTFNQKCTKSLLDEMVSGWWPDTKYVRFCQIHFGCYLNLMTFRVLGGNVDEKSIPLKVIQKQLDMDLWEEDKEDYLNNAVHQLFLCWNCNRIDDRLPKKK